MSPKILEHFWLEKNKEKELAQMRSYATAIEGWISCKLNCNFKIKAGWITMLSNGIYIVSNLIS